MLLVVIYIFLLVEGGKKNLQEVGIDHLSLNIINKTSNEPAECKRAVEDYSSNLSSFFCETLINVYQVKLLHNELILSTQSEGAQLCVIVVEVFIILITKAFSIFNGTVPVVKGCVLTLKQFLDQR